VKRLATACRSTAVALLTAVLLLSIATPALADTLADKNAEAARVQQQVEALNTKAEIAAENYNGAKDRYDTLTARVRAKGSEIAKLEKRQKRLQAELDERASLMYRQGPVGALEFLFDADNFDNFVAALNALNQSSRRDAATVAQLKESKVKAVAARAELVSARTEAARQKKSMAANKRTVNARLAASTAVLANVTADVRQLIAEQKAREAAAERARARALVARQRAAARAAAKAAARAAAEERASKSKSKATPKRPKRSGGSNVGGNPPSSGKGAKAVYWAQQKLGKRYVWGAAGPNTFDCSGLTMWAYGKAGVRLPHYSRAQIRRGSRVSRGNLQPGDLVFFGSPIHHVGMYVGGGDFIEAPYSGARVRITSLSHRRDYVGASRP